MTKAIIDLIYETFLEPNRWREVLDRIAQSIEVPAGFLSLPQKDGMQNYCTPSIEEINEIAIELGWHTTEQNIRLQNGPKSNSNIKFVRDSDFLEKDVMADSPLYRDFLNPRGWGHGAGTSLILPNQSEVAFAFENRLHAGPLGEDAINKLNILAPHLEAAMRLSSRVDSIRADSMTKLMESLGNAACAVTEDGSVVAMNELFTNLGAHISVGAFHKLMISDAVAQKQFTHILQRFMSGQVSPQSFPIRGEGGDAVTMLNVIPVMGEMRDIFTRTVALLIATPRKRDLLQETAAIESFYGLTPTEARTALELASGLSIKEIAARHNVSVGTSRNHVKSALSKTGSHRQSDLVRMINSILIF